MKTVNVAINLYQFDELSEVAKERAIEDHRNFLLSVFSVRDYEDSCQASEALEEIEENDEYIMECIRINEYYFFEDGEMATVTQYTEHHPTKAGVIEMTFRGKVYTL